MRATFLILCLLLASCNKPPVVSISHPPSADLGCPPEPDVVKLLEADPTGLMFDAAVREAGQACRDALARACRWHKERGAKVSCPEAIKP